MSDTHIDRRPFRFESPPLEVMISLVLVVGVASVTPLGHLGGVGVFVAIGAAWDARSKRIPNQLVVAIGALTVLRSGTVVISGNATLVAVAADVVAGVVLSGSLTLFVVWLLRPSAVGGGDWKLLAVVGAALGAVDPLAAAIVGVVAVAVQVAASLLAKRRQLVFAPALLIGFLAGSTATLWLHRGAAAWS